MTGWPIRPVIYEVNTAIWLADLSRTAGRPVTLADVPGTAWDDVAPPGLLVDLPPWQFHLAGVRGK